MRISHRYRFIFFANPKTGSSSVRHFLNSYTDVMPVRDYRERTADNPFYPHITPKETRRLFEDYGWDFYGYTKFVFVRNPWDRLVSLYEHIRRSGPHMELTDFEQGPSVPCASLPPISYLTGELKGNSDVNCANAAAGLSFFPDHGLLIGKKRVFSLCSPCLCGEALRPARAHKFG